MTESKQQPKRSLRKRIVSSLKSKKDDEPDDADNGHGNNEEDLLSSRSEESEASKKNKRRGEGFVGRMRSLSRSRSRSKSHGDGADRPKTIVTVTSCRSDGYYNQKAPGSTSKLPRKAPTNLKLFHELAVGIKDAYAAVGQTPAKPVLETNEQTGHPNMTEKEFHARTVLWEFIGNVDFLLALVDEVAVDTATRGALKDDTTFKGLRDVIKSATKSLKTCWSDESVDTHCSSDSSCLMIQRTLKGSRRGMIE